MACGCPVCDGTGYWDQYDVTVTGLDTLRSSPPRVVRPARRGRRRAIVCNGISTPGNGTFRLVKVSDCAWRFAVSGSFSRAIVMSLAPGNVATMTYTVAGILAVQYSGIFNCVEGASLSVTVSRENCTPGPAIIVPAGNWVPCPPPLTGAFTSGFSSGFDVAG